MTNPHNGNGGPTNHTPDDDFFAAVHRDPEAQACPEWAVGTGGGHERARALIAAVDRFLSAGCPLHPAPLLMELDERIEGTLSAGVNCHICNSSY